MIATKKKEPKRRNAERSRAKILAAAQHLFAEKGYPQTGIRDIGAAADVSSTLLLRYFGSKAGLFEAALREAMPVGAVLAEGRDKIGERLAAVFLDRRIEIMPPSIVTLSTGDADAREIATRVLKEEVVAPLARWLGPPNAQARAVEILLLAMGFVLFTRQFPLIAPHSAQERRIASWLADTLQRIVDTSVEGEAVP